MSSPPSKPSCFVSAIDPAMIDKLKNDLIEQGFTLTTPQHTIFSAQKKGVSCTVYTSGKITVQGKDKDEFIQFYLEPEILGSVSYSYPEINVDFTPRIGIDEAGKGDFFGPLCIAGLYADEAQIKELLSLGVKDSKKMNDVNILKLSKKIKESFAHSIVRIFPEKYNSLYENFKNLNKLLGWGHATAITELVEKTNCHTVIIDQFAAEHVVENALSRKNIKVNLTQRHHGEEDLVVAGASILARAAFLEGLEYIGKNLSLELPKGASEKTIEAGKKIVSKHGKEILNKIAKLHFKTKDDILQGMES